MKPSSRPIRRARRLAPLLAVIVAASCGSPTTPGSGAGTLAVTAVSPSSVTTFGGTQITVTGTNFAADAKLFIDSVALTNVTVTGTTSITGTTPAHAAGAANLSVTSGGATVPFTGSFTFVAPTGANTPPVVSLIRTIGPRSNQPSTFADLGDSIAVIATVSDKETPISQLAYAWTATAGTVTGTGSTVTWTAPATLATSPTTVALQVTVTETFTEGAVTQRQSTTSAVAIYLHDSNKEVLDMGEDFLRLFSIQVPYDQVLHNFDPNCGGYGDEQGDVLHNQATFTELQTWSITRLPPVTLNFGGICVFGENGTGNKSFRGDACANLHVHWDAKHDRDPSDPLFGTTEHPSGVDQVTAFLQNNQWRLCNSSFVADENLVSESRQVMLDARSRILKPFIRR